MANCNFTAPNGEKSKLHAGLNQLMGEPAATIAWYKLRDLSTDNEEPNLQDALVALRLGTTDQVETMNKFHSRWHLNPVPGKLMTFFATENLARSIAKQLVKSGELYENIRIRFDKTHGVIELLPQLETVAHGFGPENTINVYSSDHNGYNSLSNLAPREFTLNGIKYHSVEQYYQAEKARHAGDKIMEKNIMNARNGRDARDAGKLVKNLNVQTWDKVAYDILKAGMKASFEQNADQKALLVSTGTSTLTHIKQGINLGRWENDFPKILMEIRTEFAKSGEQPAGPKPRTEPIIGLKMDPDPVSTSEEVADFTKPADKKAPLLQPEAVQEAIDKFLKQALANPSKTYKIPYSGDAPSRKLYNGFTALDLANMFMQHGSVPDNVRFEDSFKGLMGNLPTQFLGTEIVLQDQTIREQIAVNEEMLREAQRKIMIEIKDADGKGTGKIFSADQQIEAVDSLLYETQLMVRRDGEVKMSKAKEAIRMVYTTQYLRAFTHMATGARIMSEGVDRFPHIDQALAIEYRDNMNNVLNTLDDLFKMMIQRLKLYSINVEDLSGTGNDSLSALIDDAAGKGLVDFSDEVFQLDPKDTASGRLKMFVATLEDVEIGPTPRPKSIKVSLREDARAAILAGTKTHTFRTAEQAAGDVKLTAGVLGKDTGIVKIGEKEFLATAVKVMSAADAESFNASPDKEEFKAKAGNILIRLTPYQEGQHGFNLKRSFIGTPKLANLETILEKAFGVLAGKAPNFSEYMKVLESNPDLNMQWLAKKLQAESTGQEIKDEFVSVTTKAYQEFVILMFSNGKDKNGNTFTNLRPINANRFSIKKTIIETWKEQQKLSPIVEKKSGNYSVNKELVGKLTDQFKTIRDAIAAVPKTTDKAYGNMYVAAVNGAREFVKDMFSFNGIVMPDAAYEKMISTMDTITKGTEKPGDFFSQFNVNSDGSPNGMFSAFMWALNNSIDEEQDETSMLTQNNPLYKEVTTMNILAGLYAQYAPVLYSSTHRDSQGKSVWDYSLNTYLSHTVRELTDDVSRYRADLLASDYSKNNWLLKALDKNANARSMFTVDYLDGLKNQYGKDSGVTRGEMSNREQLLLSVGLFQNSGRKGTSFLSLTHSDKTKTPVYRNILKNNVVLQGRPSNKAIEILYNTFKGEFDRIAKVASMPKGTYNHEQYEKGAHLFYQIPIFNYDEMKGRVSPEELALIWTEKGKLNTVDTMDPRFKELVNRMLMEFAEERGTTMYDRFRKEGLVTDEGTMFDRGYSKNLEQLAGVGTKFTQDKVIYENRTGGTSEITAKEYYDRLGKAGALDYGLQSFLFDTALSQILLGDPAQVFKPSKKKGATDIDHVESTMQEYQKRQAGIIAPGKDGAVDRAETYNTITLADLEVGIDYLKSVKQYAKGVNLTDAQEMTTMKEHLYVMSYYGVIKRTVYDEMVKIIDKAGPGGDYEFTEPSHKAVIFQIMKPVYYGARSEKEGAVLHDYVKSSSYPLYPPFTRGLEIDKLRKYMEKNNIHRANFISAKKIGASGAVQIFNEDKTINEAALGGKEWMEAQQQLTRGGLRLQQDTPYDETKEAILMVSQMHVLITQGIASLKDFKLSNGHTLSGTGLIAHKEAIYSKLIEKNLEGFRDSVGATIKDGVLRIADKNKFLNKLAKAAKDRGYNDNDIAAIMLRAEDGSPIIPIFLSSAADTYESLMMSLINDIVKVKIDGKSFIQASSAGIRRVSTDTSGTGIVWAPGHDGKDLQMMRRGPNGETLAAEVLVPFNFFYKKGKASLADFIDADGRIDTAKLPPELLQMVGARIPCQGHSSMIALTIAGFLPENMGDMIVVPEGITTQMGSDFDVDKLYTYRRPHQFGDGKFSPVPVEGDEVPSLKAQYFDTHWSILTHPDMYDEVTKPLDNDDMKNEAALAPAGSKLPFFDVGRQLDDFSSQKDAKRMVAYFALNTKFSAMLEGKGVKLGHLQEDDDGKVHEAEDPITIFKDEVTGKDLELLHLSTNAKGTIVDEVTKEHHVRTKQDNIKTQLSEVVDHAKNRTIDKLNLTVYTQPVAAAISLLGDAHGNAATLKHLSRFMQQEGAKMYSEAMAKSSDSLSEFTSNVKDKVIREITETISKAAGVSSGTGETYSPAQMMEFIKTTDKNKEYWKHQLNLWEAFVKLETVGKRITEIQALLNQGAKGAGPNMLTVLDKQDKFSNILEDSQLGPIMGAMNLYTRTEAGTAYDATIGTAAQVYDDVLPYSQMKGIIDTVNRHLGNNSATQMSIDTRRSIVQAMKSFVFSGTQVNIQGERTRLLFDTAQGASLAKRVMNAQDTEWGKRNYFLMRLRPALAVTGPSHVQYIASKVTSMDDLENIRGWIAMLASPVPETRFLGEDLLKYTYLNGGLQDANSFAKYIPFGYVAATDIPAYLNQSFKDIGVVMDGFIRQWFQHNPGKAKSMSEGLKETGTEYKSLPEMFKLPTLVSEDLDTNPAKGLLIKDAKGKNTYPEFLSYRDKASNRWILYTKQDGDTVPGGVRYVRIDTLGDSQTDEYNREAGIQRSLITVNRAFVNQVHSALPNNNPVPDTVVSSPVTFTVNDKIHPMWQGIGISSTVTNIQELKANVLGYIAANPNESLAHRALATHLQGIDMDPHMKAITDKIHVGFRSAREDALKRGDERTAMKMETHDDIVVTISPKIIGAYAIYPGNQIFLPSDPKALIASGAEVMLHELVHSYTLPYIDLYYPTANLDPVTTKIREDGIRNAPAGYAAIKRSIDRLEELRKQVVKDLNENDVDSSRLRYAVKNVKEFITGATTNKEVMRYLNDMPVEGNKTLLTKIIDTLAEIFTAISEMLGKPINKDSVLHEALVNIDQIMDFMRHGEFTQPSATLSTPRQQQEIVKAISQKDAVPGEQGKYELFPGVFANEMQKRAIDTIPDFVKGRLNKGGSLAERSFVLSGAGGTGKTTVIRKVLEALGTGGVTLVAPSHNAVVELKQALGDLVKDEKVKVNTIQSGLRMQKDAIKSHESGKEVYERIPPKPNSLPTPLEMAHIIIIDESSMVSDEMIRYLNEANSDAVVIFMGDYAQLQPVEQDTDAFPFSKVMHLPGQGVVLTENMRASFADVSSIVTTFRKGADILRNDPAAKIQLPLIPYAGRQNSENVNYLNKPRDLVSQYVQAFRKDPTNPKNALVIAYRNEPRRNHNTMIREALWGENAKLKYAPGELLIMNNSYGLPKDVISYLKQKLGKDMVLNGGLYNMQRVIVKEAAEADVSLKGGSDTVSIKVDGRGHVLSLNLGPDFNNEIITVHTLPKELINGIIHKIQSNGYDKVNKGFSITDPETIKILGGATFLRYGQFIEAKTSLLNMAFDAEYGYAVTSHKSQGSTYNHTFVDEADIQSVSMNTTKNKLSSLYTAVSRTKEKLFIYNPQNPAQGLTTHAAGYLEAASNTLMNGSAGPWTINTDPEVLRQEAHGFFPDLEVTTEPGERPGLTTVAFGFLPKSTGTGEVDVAIRKLQQQMSDIRGSFTDQNTTEERADKQQKLKEIDDAVKALKDTGDAKLLPKIIEQQLKWVKSTLDKDTPSANEIMTSLRIVDLWSEAIEILYGEKPGGIPGTAPSEVRKLVGDAIELKKDLNVIKIREALQAMSQSGKLVTTAFTSGLTDIDTASAYALSVNRASSLLTQEVALLMQNTARERDKESVGMIQRLSKLQDMMQSAAGSKDQKVLRNFYQQFIQHNEAGNAWGIVGLYSQDWYDFSRGLRDSRDRRIEKVRSEAAASGTALTAEQKKRVKSAWDKYWKEMDTNSIFVDTTKFFDKDGELKTGYEKHYDELKKAIGDDHAKEQLDEAQTRYRKYLEDKEAADVDVENKVLMGEYTDEEANRQKNEWYELHSPDLFFKNKSGESFTIGNKGNYYAVLSPRRSVGRFYDAQYGEIMKDKAKTAIYNEMKDLLESHKKMLPRWVQKDLGANFLPVVQNHLVNDISSVKEWWQNLNQKAIDALTATEFESANEGSDRIPIRFVNKGKFVGEDGKVDHKALSDDLPRIIELFAMMAIHYKHFARAKDGIDMGHAAIRYVDMQRRSGVAHGEALTNTLKAVEYTRDHLMYKKPKALEGNTGKKLYSLNPLKQSQISDKVKKLMGELHELENRYGAEGPAFMSPDDYEKARASILGKIAAFDGQNIYASKVGDALIKINQMKALAFNPFSGFANLAFGIVSMYTYANGRQDFTIRDSHQAMGLMRSSMKKWWTFGMSKGDTAEKIMNVINRIGVENDVVDSEYGEGNLPGRKSKLKKLINPFELLKSTDYYMKGTITVAMVLHQKLKVIKDGAEVEMSMWDALGSDGKFKYEPVDAGWKTTDDTLEEQWAKFRNKAIRVNQIIMGNMDKNSPKMLSKYVLGRLLGQFRASWLPEAFAARFEKEKEDLQLGRVIKGRYRTYMDLGFVESIKVQLKQLLGTVMKIDAFSGARKLDNTALSPVDIENMRRNFTGLAWTLTTMMAILAIKYLRDPDDEDSMTKETLMITLNLMNRLNQDLTFYSSPDVANTVTRNVIPALDVINDYIKAVSAFEKAVFNEDYGWDKAALKFTHATPYLNLINKYQYMSTRDLSTMSR